MPEYKVIERYTAKQGAVSQWHEETDGTTLGAHLTEVLAQLCSEGWTVVGCFNIDDIPTIILYRNGVTETLAIPASVHVTPAVH